MNKHALSRLDPRSHLYNAGINSIGQRALQSVQNQVLGSKIYAFYEDAFWLNKGKFSGDIFTDDFLGETRLYDGKGTCDAQGKNCSGWLLASYRLGGTEKRVIPLDGTLGYREPSMLNVIRPDNVQKKLFLDMVHENVLKSTAVFTTEEERRTISKPTVAVYANWATSDWYGPHAIEVLPSDVPAGQWLDNAIHPISSSDLFIVNCDISAYPGWAEGSLLSAERVLHKYYDIDRPSWLEQYWYKGNIIDENV